MNLSEVALDIRTAKPWQALDIGLHVAREWWWPMFLSWLAAPAVLLAVLNLVIPSHPFIAGTVVWWLKPFWDRLPLFYLSRALFSAPPSLLTLYQSLWHICKQDALPWLLWRRFSPGRSFVMPVTLLEQLKGNARSKRLHVLHNNASSAPTALTVILFHLESFLPIALVAVVAMFVPQWESVDYLTWAQWLQNALLPAWLLTWCYLFGAALVAPFYVGGGFMLYIQRRIELEGWDIEIGFRKMVALRHGTSALLLAVVFIAAGVSQANFSYAAELPDYLQDSGTEAPATPREQARAEIADVLAGEDFNRTQTVYYWRKKDRSQPDDSGLEQWLQKWLANNEAGLSLATLAQIALVLELLLWASVAALVATLIYQYRGMLSFIKFAPRSRGKASIATAPEVLFGLPVSPASLPRDIAGDAERLLRAGEAKAALTLLYRAALSHFTHQECIALGKDLTELECADAVAAHIPQQSRSDYFRRITEAWLTLNYAHKTPAAEQIATLVAPWRAVFAERGAQ